jgi:hypothetical protein
MAKQQKYYGQLDIPFLDNGMVVETRTRKTSILLLTCEFANASMSSALAATTGVNATATANAPAFLNMFLLESSTLCDLGVAASAVSESGLDVVVVVNASAEAIARRKTTET